MTAEATTTRPRRSATYDTRTTVLAPEGGRGTHIDIEVLSLDVFDTMLVRSCGAPESLYLWLGRRLHRLGLLTCGVEVFARARHRVEMEVWEREGGPDASVAISDFYSELARILAFDPQLVDRLVEEELCLEAEVLRPTGPSTDLLELADSVGLQVVFTSDMYLPGSFIRRQLKRHGLWPPGARCFSSTDYGASKSTGSLYATVAQRLGVQASSILHLGDNPGCDVRAGRDAGVQARWLPEGRLNRYEQLLADARWATAGMSAALAGASRLARMHTPAEGERERALRDVAAGVAAPALTAYVLWVLNRAGDLGLERLYFVSRDGQVLAELAAILAERLRWEIDIRYLYASRRTVNPSVAGVGETDSVDADWVFRNRDDVSLGHLLGRLDVDLPEAASLLAAAGLPDATESTRLTAEVRAVLEAAVSSGPLRDLAVTRARARRAVAVDYLRQEGVFDGRPCGIVDLGGVGSQMGALHALCVSAGAEPPRLFLLGLDRHPDPEQAAQTRRAPWLESTECYLFDEQRGYGTLPPRGLVTSLQMFCSADHATVVGYERSRDRIAPVLSGDVRSLVSWGLPVVRRTVHEFARQLVLEDDLVDPGADLRPAACAVVQEFWTNPTSEEGRAWGAFPFEGGELTGPLVKPLAEPYTWPRLGRELVEGSFPHHAWNHWHEGSVASSAPLLRTSILGARRVYRRLQTSGGIAGRTSRALAARLRKR